MNWPGPTVHRQRRLPGDEPGRRVQEGAGDEHRRPGRRRRDRRRARPGWPRSTTTASPSPRTWTARPAPVHPRESRCRSSTSSGADIIFAFDECTTLMNTRGYQERSVRRTQAWAERCLAEHGRLTAERDRPAVPGAVRGGPGRAVRGPAPAGQPRSGRRSTVDGQRLRRLRHRRRAGEGEPGHHRRLVRRGAAGGQAAAPARHLRAGRLLHRDRERRRHLRLRLAVPGRAQRRGLHPRRPVQRQHRRLAPRVRRRSTPSATATPARTTPGPTCTTCSRRRRCWPRRCAPSTTSASSSRLVDRIRASIDAGDFDAFRAEFLGRYYG